MKKTYVTPEIEKVAFQYRDQVVAASGSGACTEHYTGLSDRKCDATHWSGDNVN